jgi:hypothetical protein
MSIIVCFTAIHAGVPPQEGACGPKFMSNYIAVLLLMVAVCAVLIVGELGALVSYTSKMASPGMFNRSIIFVFMQL